MKKRVFFQLLVLIISLFYAVSAHSTSFYNYRGDGVWHDANKTGDGDTLLCWAAAASNILDWGGWGNNIMSPSGQTESLDAQQILRRFTLNWSDDTGFMENAWKWWINGTAPTTGSSIIDGKGGAGNYWPIVDVNDYLKTYDPYYYTQGVMDYLGNYLWWGLGTTIAIATAGGAHALTVWGYEYGGNDSYDYKGIYYTDSDDEQTALLYSEVELRYGRWYLSGRYSSWYMYGVYGLYETDFETKFVPKSRPVSEPSTLLLMISSIAGLVAVRRKLKK